MNSLFLIINFICLFELLFLLSYFYNRSSIATNILLLFVIIWYSLVVGFRPIDIPDTKAYIDLFKKIDSVFDNRINGIIVSKYDAEIGYVISNYFIKSVLGFNYRMFLILITVFNVLCALYFLQITQLFSDSQKTSATIVEYNPFLSLIIFIPYFGAIYSGIALRAGLALSFSLLAFTQILKKRYIPTAMFLIVSFLFHRIAIVFVLSIFIYYVFPIGTKRVYTIFWIMLLSFMLLKLSNYWVQFVFSILENIFSSISIVATLSHYFKSYAFNVSYGYQSWFILILCGLLIRFGTNNIQYWKYINVFCFGLLIMVSFGNLYGISRVYEFLTIMSLPLLYNQFRNYKASKISRYFILLFYSNLSCIFALRIWDIL